MLNDAARRLIDPRRQCRPKVHFIETSDAGAWEQALTGIDHSFWHKPEACRAFFVSTGYPTRLFVAEDREFKTVCVLAERTFRGRTDVFTPPGFSGFATAGAAENFENIWHEIGRQQGWVCAYIQEHPLLASPFGTPLAGQLGRACYILDIGLAEQDLLARMSQSRRRQLSRPLAGDCEILPSFEPPISFLAAQANRFFADRQADPTAIPSLDGWAYIASSPACVTFEARIHSEIQAVSLFGVGGSVAEYLYNISSDVGQGLSAHLIWRAIPSLRQLGCRYLNLGGGIRANDNVAEFKRRFGPDALPIVTRRDVFDEAAYGEFTRLSGASQDRGYFPAYRTKDSLHVHQNSFVLRRSLLVQRL